MSKTKRCRCVVKNPVSTPGLVLPGTPPCIDVCTNPICAEPTTLTLMGPVVYDQVGLNLCSPVTLTGLDGFPTAQCATAQVTDITYGTGTAVTPITGRPNCYQVALANLTVTFSVRVFDSCNRLLTTITATAVYLPPTTADNYDEDTNPDLVEFDIFAPYGITFTTGGTPEPLLNFIGFTADNGTLVQGLNVTAVAKVLGLDVEDSTATVGLTLYVASIYYAPYQFTGISRADVPKISLVPEDNSRCQEFVEGDLLNLAIKPLELGAPYCEGLLKQDCTDCNTCCCGTDTATTTPDPGDGG